MSEGPVNWTFLRPLSNARFLKPVGEMNIWFGFFLGWGTTAAPAWTRAT